MTEASFDTGSRPDAGVLASVAHWHEAVSPFKTTRPATRSRAAAAGDGAQRVMSGVSTFGVAEISAYITSPEVSAAMVLTHGIPRLADNALCACLTLIDFPSESQAATIRLLTRLTSVSA